MSEKNKKNVILFLKGMAMGGADIVPGVSGGTIAFITGIYEELLNSINSFDLDAFKLLKQFELKKFWQKINGVFLIVLFAGIITSALSLVKIVSYFLEHNPIQLWSFFFGLVIISAVLVSKEIKSWNFNVVLSGIIGIVVSFAITSLSPASTPDELWFVFLAGALAICAMILPGISGSFILLMLGKYEFIINAIKEFNIVVIITFIFGCLTGLLSFSRVISWLLTKYHSLAVALLAGFMIGSLNKIWPWKKVLETFTDRHGDLKPLKEANILPTTFEKMGQEPFVLQAILFAAIGILIVVIIEKIASAKA